MTKISFIILILLLVCVVHTEASFGYSPMDLIRGGVIGDKTETSHQSKEISELPNNSTDCCIVCKYQQPCNFGLEKNTIIGSSFWLVLGIVIGIIIFILICNV